MADESLIDGYISSALLVDQWSTMPGNDFYGILTGHQLQKLLGGAPIAQESRAMPYQISLRGKMSAFEKAACAHAGEGGITANCCYPNARLPQ